MKVRTLVVIGGGIVIAMLAVSAWAWPQIPDGAQVPIHWGPSGEIDGYAPKAVGLLGLPALTVGLVALLALIPRIEPRRDNLRRSGTAYIAVCLTALAFMGVIHGVAVLAALGNDIDIAAIALFGSGAMFIVIGNFLGKTRSNWFFGIRTPWTLSSELSWTRTHRAGGWLFIGVGALVLLTTVVLGSEVALWVMLGSLLLGTAALFVYSYVVWRGDPARAATEAPR
jgi:uncharacterized membrane protein